MTVGKLINKLQKFDPNLEVLSSDHDHNHYCIGAVYEFYCDEEGNELLEKEATEKDKAVKLQAG